MGMGDERALDRRRETLAVDRKRASSRELVRIARAHDQRTRAPHLLMEQPDRVVLPIVGTE